MILNIRIRIPVGCHKLYFGGVVIQTFLPVVDFYESANILDRQRCWQQLREASLILQLFDMEKQGYNKKPYRNHPAIRQWRGYEPALEEYYNVFYGVCVGKWKVNIKAYFLIPSKGLHVEYPSWLGYEPYHSSHRSRLLQKNYEYYRKFDWGEDNCELEKAEYLWPVDLQGNLLPEIKRWYDEKVSKE